MIHIIGIDCAVDDANVGLALGVLEGSRLKVEHACPGNAPGSTVIAKLKEWIKPRIPASPVLLAIDAPLGWPELLGASLVGHRAGQPLPNNSNLLFRRRTDAEIKDRIGRQSLDVGADRIARTAHRALHLLAELAVELKLREIPLAWEPSFQQGVRAIEVYPAATLTACPEIRFERYKQAGEAELRGEVIQGLREYLTLPEDLDGILRKDVDVLDAVVCLLAGADFLRGWAKGPEDEERRVARKEGWIWCRGRV